MPGSQETIDRASPGDLSPERAQCHSFQLGISPALATAEEGRIFTGSRCWIWLFAAGMVYAGDSGFEGQIEDAVIPSVKFMCCWKVLSCDTISPPP